MIESYARVRGLRKRLIVKVPLLSPRVSSYWVDLVTPVDRRVSHSLIESLTGPVLVENADATAKAFEIKPRELNDALAEALADQGQATAAELFGLAGGLENGVYSVRKRVHVADPERVSQALTQIGGDLAWYGIPWAWKVRIMVGKLFGEKLGLLLPPTISAGSSVDWWTVKTARPGELVLATRDWKVGEGWLGYRLSEDGMLEQAAAFRPKGVPGFLYWKLLGPFHAAAFSAMLRARANPAGPHPDGGLS
ncbi:MAG: DUF2867 domain-containing protein [Actinomycetota bacterium]